jgi:SAM-dependent methyltransferase
MQLTTAAEIYRTYKANTVNALISNDDLMFVAGQTAHYFHVGEDGLNNVLSSLVRSRLERVESILDLPCGHGRVARHLRAAFPEAKMSFCDIDKGAADFCARTFDGVPLYSSSELTQVPLHRSFDIIWIGSLFTHVDESRTRRWLRYLCDQLTSDGILLATFHGVWVRESHNQEFKRNYRRLLRQVDRYGFGYARQSRLEDYGVSVSLPWKVVEMASAMENVRILGYTERGWDENHDVLTIARTDRLKPFVETNPQVMSNRDS